MKALRFMFGLFIFGLITKFGLTESNQQSENSASRKTRQAYLAPSIENEPIAEEIITIHEEDEGGNDSSQFQESNYGDAKYQTFEVHNNFGSQGGNGFSADGYLPPHQGDHGGQSHHSHGGNGQNQANYNPNGVQEEVIRVQHIHVLPPTTSVHQNVPSPLPSHHGSHGAHSVAPIQPQEHRSSEYLPPPRITHQEHSHHHHQEHSHHHQQDHHHHQENYHEDHHHQDYHQDQHHQDYHQHNNHQDYHQDHHQQDYHQDHHQQNHQSSHHHQEQVHFSPPEQQNHNNQYQAPDYLPPHNQPSVAAAPQANYKAPDVFPPLDSPPNNYQPAPIAANYQHSESYQQAPIQPSPQFKAPDYLPPQTENIASHEAPANQPATPYKAPDYLPPHHEGQARHISSHHVGQPQQQPQQQQQISVGAQYSAPHHSSHAVAHTHVQQFKGPSYLPPHHHQGAPGQVPQTNAYKGPEYLPPNQEQHIHSAPQSEQFKGPDYLPPHSVSGSALPAGYDYREPKTPNVQPQQPTHYQQPLPQPVHQPNPLPSGYDFVKPENAEEAIAELHTLPADDHNEQQSHVIRGQGQHGINYQANSYLPPQNVQQSTVQAGASSAVGGQESFHHSGPQQVAPQTYSPPSHPAGIPARPIHGEAQHGVNYHGNSYLPPQTVQQSPPQAVASSSVGGQESFQQHQSGPQPVAPQIYSPPPSHNQGQAHHGGNFRGNSYLPPQTVQQSPPQAVASSSAGSQGNFQQQQSGPQQVAPQIFSPPPSSSQNPLPPQAVPVQAQRYASNLHSLSSQMTNVQPFERYAAAPRQPFREYGPPPGSSAVATSTASQHQRQPPAPPIAPMYREQASRPSYYAPAMPYATHSMANLYTTYTTHQQQPQPQPQPQQHRTVMDEQTRNNLQQFMPKDIAQHPVNVVSSTAQHQTAPAPVSHSVAPSNKIRTVQILSPASVKTLKVLETLDHAGVKTIKILGHSQENPSGDHHIVKVITQNAHDSHEHVHTVKIFNDQTAATSGGGAVSQNAYLPPSTRVVRQSPLKIHLLANQKRQLPFTGRLRYRS